MTESASIPEHFGYEVIRGTHFGDKAMTGEGTVPGVPLETSASGGSTSSLSSPGAPAYGKQISELSLLAVTALITVGVSALGAYIFGHSFSVLLELPPKIRMRAVPSLSPWLFALGEIFLALVIAPIALALHRAQKVPQLASSSIPSRKGAIPWYGYAATGLVGISWLIAWTRLPLFAAVQHHTYVGLWFGYIFCVEAILVRLGEQPTWKLFRRYWLLYPVSALFWWSYEWLNRIVENWSYLNVDRYGPSGYILLATVSFSTVLPAVVATGRLLYRSLPFEEAFSRYVPLRLSPLAEQRGLRLALLVLLLLPAAPDELYPLLWPAPLCLVLLLEKRFLQNGYLYDLDRGRWDRVICAAIAALVCGFFWEMWNSLSLAKWIYHVPYVGEAHLFEMPLLGFGGYLPFGVLCAAVARLVLKGDPIAPDSSAPETSELHGAVPSHIAIIMDGNGRWARARGLPRSAGHRAGVERLRDIVRECRRAGVSYLTVFAFSEENWKRPEAEVSLLMAILEEQLSAAADELRENDIRLRVMGNIDRLPLGVQRALRAVEAQTKDCNALQLVVALSYGARQELVHVIESLRNAGTEQVDENSVRKHLYLPDLPDPDLLIRTSGELRLSNFLLWQAAYAELAFVDTFWPDFGAEQLRKLIQEYGKRVRRYGALSNDSSGTTERQQGPHLRL